MSSIFSELVLKGKVLEINFFKGVKKHKIKIFVRLFVITFGIPFWFSTPFYSKSGFKGSEGMFRADKKDK